MKGPPSKSFELVGVIRVREHCAFRWHEPEGGSGRTAEVGPEHCEDCLRHLRRLGYRLISKRADPTEVGRRE